MLVPYNKLSNAQKGIIQRVSRDTGNLFVEGPAGTGKTLISMYAVKNLTSEKAIRPLVLMYNHSLYGYLKDSFRKLDLYDNITLDTKDNFFKQLASSYGIYLAEEGYYKTKYNNLLDQLSKANLTKKWDVAVVDEVQDFTSAEWMVLKMVAGNIISMGNFNQKVYDTDLRRNDITGISRREGLNEIFRFHQNIAEVAKHFNKDSNNIAQNVTKKEQKQPKLIDVQNTYEEAKEVRNILNALKNHQKKTAIISPVKKRLEELREKLEEYGIETTFFTNNSDFRDYDFSDKKPLLLTAHSAKGLEFENVIVLGFEKSLNEWYTRDLDELIYVALTRANSGLYIIRTPETIQKIKDLRIEEARKNAETVDDLFSF